MPKVRTSLLAGWLVAMATNGCNVDLRPLGTVPAPAVDAGAVDTGALPQSWVPFGPVTLHPALVTAPGSQADPTLPADELELYYTTSTNTGGTYDIWMCPRTSSTAAWGTCNKAVELSSDTALDETPEVSADGLTIYLASDRPGTVAGEHLWVSHRATRTDPWGQPTQVTDLIVGDKDLSPTLQQAQQLMIFASQFALGDWNLYATTRSSTTDPWGAPTLLAELNSTAYDWDPALYQEGTSIVFASRRLNTANSLFYATRASLADPFSTPQPATELNVNNDGDPWLSNDGHHIVFDSRRGGGASKIYEAWR
jgi:Tol biopolymer transport system component